jgi:plastocyanin
MITWSLEMLRSIKFHLLSITLLSLGVFHTANAMETFDLSIRNHMFEPAEITIPANQKVKLVVKNLDATPEEFESYDLNREKIISGNGKAVIFIGPVKPGTYKFFGEFNPKTAQGIIIAK